jgi:tRNA pseudouridine38-40 synthase
VQGELEHALSRLSAGKKVQVAAAGRTDAGVHAVGQVIAFTYAGRLDRQPLAQALGALLPADIGLAALRRQPDAYRPRSLASQRHYRYTIWNGPSSPFRERYALVIPDALDVAAMMAAAEVLTGRHDFSAFGGASRHPLRTVHRLRIRRHGRWITIDVVGDAFLRHMVRRLVAALLRVGRRQANVEDVAAALRSTEPAFDGDTSPARGLCLWRVAVAPIGEAERTGSNR